jgi:hypothetical protein
MRRDTIRFDPPRVPFCLPLLDHGREKMPRDRAHIAPIYVTCIVCGKKPLTETHIWPRWLKRVLPRQKNYDVVADYAEPGLPVVRRRRSVQKYKRDLFSRDPLLACSDCNGVG